MAWSKDPQLEIATQWLKPVVEAFEMIRTAEESIVSRDVWLMNQTAMEA